jgi:hypothetical protein
MCHINEECWSWVFENMLLRVAGRMREDRTGGWRKIYIEELHSP